MPSDCHRSRCRRSSTSRTIWLLRKSLRISYSKVPALSIRPPPQSAGHSIDAAQLGAARARVGRHFCIGRDHRMLGQHLRQHLAPAARRRDATRARAERVLHDAVFQRVKRDHRHPSTSACSLGLQHIHCRPINESSPSSSPLTQMRSAWNVRVAGSIRCHPRAATARRTISASRAGAFRCGSLLPRHRRSPAPPAATRRSSPN